MYYYVCIDVHTDGKKVKDFFGIFVEIQLAHPILIIYIFKIEKKGTRSHGEEKRRFRTKRGLPWIAWENLFRSREERDNLELNFYDQL
jgi:hypothetical protein